MLHSPLHSHTAHRTPLHSHTAHRTPHSTADVVTARTCGPPTQPTVTIPPREDIEQDTTSTISRSSITSNTSNTSLNTSSSRNTSLNNNTSNTTTPTVACHPHHPRPRPYRLTSRNRVGD